MADDTPRIVPCPTCEQAVKWTTQNPYRPFCSERCKLIDFGDWAGERHRIPAGTDDSSSTSDTPH